MVACLLTCILAGSCCGALVMEYSLGVSGGNTAMSVSSEG